MAAELDVEALADSTRALLRELADLRAESEALRRELEHTWPDDDDRPTLPAPDNPTDRDTLRC